MEFIKTLEGDYVSVQFIRLEEEDPGYNEGWSYEARFLSKNEEDTPIYWGRSNTFEESKEYIKPLLNKLRGSFDSSIKELRSLVSKDVENFISNAENIDSGIGYLIRNLNGKYIGYILKIKEDNISISDGIKMIESSSEEDPFIIVTSITKDTLRGILSYLITAYSDMKRDIDVIIEFM